MATCNLVMNIKIKPWAKFILYPMVAMRITPPLWLFKNMCKFTTGQRDD